MKVVVASSFAPFVKGGGRFIVEWLETKLREHGHQVERFYLPFNEAPETLLDNLLAYRLLDLAEGSDRLIAIRPPAHSIRHPNKVVWFIHHLRGYYDLAHTDYSLVPDSGGGRAIAAALHRHDTACLKEARAVFTNSTVVKERLASFNGIGSEVLYPPLFRPEQFFRGEPNGEIVSVCRVESHKRQHLLIAAMALVRTPVKLRLCGASANPDYEKELRRLIANGNLQDRVTIESGWISEERKAELVSHCLASVYAPVDEDSYGYPTLEAAAARKPTVTTWDAGGTLEFVRDGENGLIAEPSHEALADAFDRLYADPARTAQMGEAAFETVLSLKITWDHVLQRLLA